MQFKDNKNNFTFSKDTLLRCSLTIKNWIKKGKDPEEHPVEKAIREAKKFIYIISPYVSPKTMELLIKKKKENSNIEIKLICSYRPGFFEKKEIKINIVDLESFAKLISHTTEEQRLKIKENINQKYSNKINNIKNLDEEYSEIEKENIKLEERYSNLEKDYINNDKLINNCIKFFMFLCFFSVIYLGFLYHLNKFSNSTLLPIGIIFIFSISLISWLSNKKLNLNKKCSELLFQKNILSDKKINLSNKKFDLSNQIEELKACKKNELNKVQSEIPPEIFWENFDCKITKNKYNSSNLEDVPLIHTKLYLTDGTLTNKQTKHTFSITRAFLSSANFTYSGLHFNNEFLFETTDSELTKELKEYFENFYDSLDENLLTKEEIQKELFKYKSELLNKKQE